jgi:hypothetical protein
VFDRCRQALNLGMRCLYQGASGAVMRRIASSTGPVFDQFSTSV